MNAEEVRAIVEDVICGQSKDYEIDDIRDRVYQLQERLEQLIEGSADAFRKVLMKLDEHNQ